MIRLGFWIQIRIEITSKTKKESANRGTIATVLARVPFHNDSGPSLVIIALAQCHGFVHFPFLVSNLNSTLHPNPNPIRTSFRPSCLSW